MSDHRPILLKEMAVDFGPTPFRLFHSWFLEDGFVPVVEDSWNNDGILEPNAIIHLKKKLQALKLTLKTWNTALRHSRSADRDRFHRDLVIIETRLDQGLEPDLGLDTRSETLKKISDIDRFASLDAAQKAKVNWAVEGDENSSFFHGVVNKRRRQMSIRGVMVDGDWVTAPDRVKREFLLHFSERFSKPTPFRAAISSEFQSRLTTQQHLELDASVTREEVKRAVWDCGADKAPGPDGFTFEFFRKFWYLVEEEVVAAVLEFFSSSIFPRGCNPSFIALIPKVANAVLVSDFRPISLIGFQLKIVGKILSNRMATVIDGLVSKEQSAFVKGRQILDGPMILNEVVAWCKASKQKAMVFKVDFEKAYDTLRWDFLEDVLLAFGFGPKWRSWIRGCLVSSMGSVLVNGCPTPEFKYYRGLRQGDPLSPFLFILAMESLHIAFSNAMRHNWFSGLQIGASNPVVLSHLFYADDAIFIGEWSDSNLSNIIDILRCFYLASGLKINLTKSKILGIGVSDAVVGNMAARIGCSVLKTPFPYLGVTVGGNMTRVAAWSDIIQKVTSRLSNWKAKTLSVGGRLTLLKAVLGALPTYFMSIYKAPIAVLSQIEALRNKFFLGADLEEKKMTWVSWKQVMASKDFGGLGVTSLFALNRALLFKWVWRFCSKPDALWAVIIRAIHGDFRFRHPSRRPTLSGSAWGAILSSISDLRKKGVDLMECVSRCIGNGADTFFWTDAWLTTEPLSSKFPRVFALENDKLVSVRRKFDHVDWFTSFRRPPRSGAEWTQWEQLLTLLDSVVLSPVVDRWKWSLHGSGDFLVSSARNHIDSIVLPNIPCQMRWNNLVPIKVNVFIWRLVLDRLPFRWNLSRRGLDIPSLDCPICATGTDMLRHLFFQCEVATDLAGLLCCWWRLPVTTCGSFQEWSDWFVSLALNQKTNDCLEASFFT